MERDFIDDPVNLYLAEVAKVPTLNRAEELDCIRRVRAGGNECEIAGKRLLEANLSLVVSLARRHIGGNASLLDLTQKGNEGLLNALRILGTSDQDGFATIATAEVQHAIAERTGDAGGSR